MVQWPTRFVLFLLPVLVLAFGAAPADAQGPGCPPRCPGGGGNLTFTLSTTAVAFATPAVLDFDAGWVEHTGVIVSVASNPAGSLWELRIRANTATLGGYGKPVNDVLWRHDGSTIWTPLTGTDQAVLQGSGSQDVTIYFRVLLDWTTDSPDAYSAGLTFSTVRP